LRILPQLKWIIMLTAVVMLTDCSDVNKNLLVPASISRNYLQDVKPIFDRSCVRCHGNDVQNGISIALNLSSYANIENFIGDAPADDIVIVPGSANSRILIKLDRESDGMYKYLDDPEDFNIIYDWIVLGMAAE